MWKLRKWLGSVYYLKLLNIENAGNKQRLPHADLIQGPVIQVDNSMVCKMIKVMKGEKAVSLSEIVAEMFKIYGEVKYMITIYINGPQMKHAGFICFQP